MSKITFILALSGGLDSTYTLYDWLRNPENKKQRILVHHVNLHHPAENRLAREKRAVRNILAWLLENDMSNFIYHESSFDYGTLPSISIKDIQIVSMFTASLLKTTKYKSIDNIILSWHKGEVNSREIDRGFRVKAMFETLEVGRAITFHFPIEHKTRRDMINDMPSELLQHVHSCRKPTLQRPICGYCKTCKEYIAEGLEPI